MDNKSDDVLFKEAIIFDVSKIFNEKDVNNLGKGGKTLSQYATYQKDSSHFGINNTDMEINSVNYSGIRKMMDMIADKLPYINEKNLTRLGSKEINSWILKNLIREEFHLRSIIVYFERKKHVVPVTYLMIFTAFKKVVKIAKQITKKSENEIAEEDLISQSVIDLISSELDSAREALFLNQYFKQISPFQDVKVLYKVPPNQEDFNHPLIQFCVRQLRLKGTKQVSIHTNLVLLVKYFFIWMTNNVELFKGSNLNNIIVNRITEEHINDYRSYLLRLIGQGEITEISAKQRIDSIRTFFTILYQKKRISNDIASSVSRINVEEYKFRRIPKDQELEKLLEVIYIYSDEPKKELLAFSLMLYMGLRGIEVAKLKWEDINLGTKTIVINESKRNSSILPIPQLIYNQLLKIYDKDSGYIFQENPKIYKTKLYRMYKIYTLIAGWDYEGGLHLLRHTFITKVTKYSSPLIIMDLARHTSGHMPSRYIHLERQYVKDELVKLDLIEGDLK